MVHIPPNPDVRPNNFVDEFFGQIDPDISSEERCNQLYRYAEFTPLHEPRPSSDAMIEFIDTLDRGGFDAYCAGSILTRKVSIRHLQKTLAGSYPAILDRLDSTLLETSIKDLESGGVDYKIKQNIESTIALLLDMNSDKAIEILKWHALNNPNFDVVKMAASALAIMSPEKALGALCDISTGELYEKSSMNNENIETVRRYIYNGRALLAADGLGSALLYNKHLSLFDGARALYCLIDTAITGNSNVSKKAIEGLLLFAYSLLGLDSLCEQLGKCCL